MVRMDEADDTRAVRWSTSGSAAGMFFLMLCDEKLAVVTITSHGQIGWLSQIFCSTRAWKNSL